jgi:hypothetical protein
MVEFGTTTNAGNAFHVWMIWPKNVEIWTVLPYARGTVSIEVLTATGEPSHQTHLVSKNAGLLVPPVVTQPVESINLVRNDKCELSG